MVRERCPQCGTHGRFYRWADIFPPADDEAADLPASLMHVYAAYSELGFDQNGRPDLWGSGELMLDRAGVRNEAGREWVRKLWRVARDEHAEVDAVRREAEDDERRAASRKR